MKELSLEEKAKRYDELLVKLQEAKIDNNVCDDKYCCVIDDIVPELKESKDEKIREAIYNCVRWFGFGSCFFKYVSQEECFAWLEKQGEQEPGWKSNEHYELEEFAKIVRGNLTGISKTVQKLFEAKYSQLTGNKMYGGFKD